MGYELHISRRKDWTEPEPSDITMDEWLSYVASDSELDLINGYNVQIGSEMRFQNRPGFCEWNSHPFEKESSSKPWFDYSPGVIETKHPDLPTIRKMLQIASALNANVQGDDGEIYDEKYLQHLEAEKMQKELSSKVPDKKPWWKFW